MTRSAALRRAPLLADLARAVDLLTEEVQLLSAFVRQLRNAAIAAEIAACRAEEERN